MARCRGAGAAGGAVGNVRRRLGCRKTVVAQTPLGIWTLELQSREKLEKYSVQPSAPRGQVPAAARAPAGSAPADRVGLGHPDPTAGSTKPLQGGRPHLPEASGQGNGRGQGPRRANPALGPRALAHSHVECWGRSTTRPPRPVNRGITGGGRAQGQCLQGGKA